MEIAGLREVGCRKLLVVTVRRGGVNRREPGAQRLNRLPRAGRSILPGRVAEKPGRPVEAEPARWLQTSGCRLAGLRSAQSIVAGRAGMNQSCNGRWGPDW